LFREVPCVLGHVLVDRPEQRGGHDIAATGVVGIRWIGLRFVEFPFGVHLGIELPVLVDDVLALAVVIDDPVRIDLIDDSIVDDLYFFDRVLRELLGVAPVEVALGPVGCPVIPVDVPADEGEVGGEDADIGTEDIGPGPRWGVRIDVVSLTGDEPVGVHPGNEMEREFVSDLSDCLAVSRRQVLQCCDRPLGREEFVAVLLGDRHYVGRSAPYRCGPDRTSLCRFADLGDRYLRSVLFDGFQEVGEFLVIEEVVVFEELRIVPRIVLVVYRGADLPSEDARAGDSPDRSQELPSFQFHDTTTRSSRPSLI
jgi:hypothetical protein